MRLMISELKGVATLLFPLVFGGGMLQVYNVVAASQMVTTAIPLPTVSQLMTPAMVYPVLLVPFFRLDGSKILFRVATVILVSAIMGIVAFPLLAVIFDAAISQFDSSVPWFNLLVLVVDLLAAFGFLVTLRETDMHRMPKSLIYGSLAALEGLVCLLVIYNSGVWIKPYNYAAVKIGFAPYVASNKQAQAPAKQPGQQVAAAGTKAGGESLADVARTALSSGLGKDPSSIAAINTADTPAVRDALTKVMATQTFSDPVALAKAIRAGRTDADREAIATVVARLRVVNN